MIKLLIPSVPPSSNHAYTTVGKARVLSSKGKKYKTETTTYIVQHFRKEMMLFKPNVPFGIILRFWFADVENKGWGTGKAENRYKTFDGGNRTKLLEDCLKDAGGIDDSQTLQSTWIKKAGLPERTEVWAWNLEEDTDPFDYDFALAHL